jgi:hypothetical protein
MKFKYLAIGWYVFLISIGIIYLFFGVETIIGGIGRSFLPMYLGAGAVFFLQRASVVA